MYCRFVREKSINQAIRFLQQSWVKVFAASEKAAENYTAVKYEGPVAIVMGAEDTGVSPENLRICDNMVKIPQFGTIGSLECICSHFHSGVRGGSPTYERATIIICI